MLLQVSGGMGAAASAGAVSDLPGIGQRVVSDLSQGVDGLSGTWTDAGGRQDAVRMPLPDCTLVGVQDSAGRMPPSLRTAGDPEWLGSLRRVLTQEGRVPERLPLATLTQEIEHWCARGRGVSWQRLLNPQSLHADVQDTLSHLGPGLKRTVRAALAQFSRAANALTGASAARSSAHAASRASSSLAPRPRYLPLELCREVRGRPTPAGSSRSTWPGKAADGVRSGW